MTDAAHTSERLHSLPMNRSRDELIGTGHVPLIFQPGAKNPLPGAGFPCLARMPCRRAMERWCKHHCCLQSDPCTVLAIAPGFWKCVPARSVRDDAVWGARLAAAAKLQLWKAKLNGTFCQDPAVGMTLARMPHAGPWGRPAQRSKRNWWPKTKRVAGELTVEETRLGQLSSRLRCACNALSSVEHLLPPPATGNAPHGSEDGQETPWRASAAALAHAGVTEDWSCDEPLAKHARSSVAMALTLPARAVDVTAVNVTVASAMSMELSPVGVLRCPNMACSAARVRTDALATAAWLWGVPFVPLRAHAKWRGWREMVAAYVAHAAHLASRDPMQLVVHADASDMLLQASADEIRARFEEIASGKPLVLGLERSCPHGRCVPAPLCWHDAARRGMVRAGTAAPRDASGGFVHGGFVNGGFVMGRAWAVHRLWRGVAANLGNTSCCHHGQLNPQLGIGRLAQVSSDLHARYLLLPHHPFHSMASHGVAWLSGLPHLMASHGFSWLRMASHGVAWRRMALWPAASHPMGSPARSYRAILPCDHTVRSYRAILPSARLLPFLAQSYPDLIAFDTDGQLIAVVVGIDPQQRQLNESQVCMAMAHGAWCMAHGAWRWRMTHGAWRMVHGAWCM